MAVSWPVVGGATAQGGGGVGRAASRSRSVGRQAARIATDRCRERLREPLRGSRKSRFRPGIAPPSWRENARRRSAARRVAVAVEVHFCLAPGGPMPSAWASARACYSGEGRGGARSLVFRGEADRMNAPSRSHSSPSPVVDRRSLALGCGITLSSAAVARRGRARATARRPARGGRRLHRSGAWRRLCGGGFMGVCTPDGSVRAERSQR